MSAEEADVPSNEVDDNTRPLDIAGGSNPQSAAASARNSIQESPHSTTRGSITHDPLGSTRGSIQSGHVSARGSIPHDSLRSSHGSGSYLQDIVGERRSIPQDDFGEGGSDVHDLHSSSVGTDEFLTARGSFFQESLSVLPSTQRKIEIQNAKAYMLKASAKSSMNLYDHLSELLSRILDERPESVIDIFEELSRALKRERYMPAFDVIRDEHEQSTEFNLAESQKPLFAKSSETDIEVEPDDELESPLPNFMDLMFFFEQTGIGFGREESYRIFLALKQLVDIYPLQTVRFWGKILGTKENYLVAEVMYKEGEDEEEGEEEEEEEKEEKKEEEEEEEEGQEKDNTPKPDYKPPVAIPKEDNRTGVNKYTYFVCNDPGKPWTKLPQATPAQIVISRKIKKFFTGKLDAPIISFPPFPGNEANYLRAQIARISAGSQVSPNGYYIFDDEEEEDEDEEGRTEFIENTEFEGIPVRELVDPSLSNWVHHVLHILPQGRCTWFNPVKKGEEDYDEDDEEEDEQEEDEEIEPEVGPALLSSLSEDMEADTTSRWTCKLSSTLIPQYAIAYLRSNLWPGAAVYSDGKKFENIYVGFGLKYNAENYSPEPPPPMMKEYSMGPDVTEAEDPSVEEEAALKAAQEEAAAAAEEMEDMEEEEEDED